MKELITKKIHEYAATVWGRGLIMMVIVMVLLFMSDFVFVEGTIEWTLAVLGSFFLLISLIPDGIILLTSILLKLRNKTNE